jgi:hypothetical protein
MPTFTRSFFDPKGSYQSDAMDQVEQWNANRGDQWSQYALNMANKNREEDWRKDVALKQLGLQSEMYQGGRQESALERQARADAEKARYGYMTGRDTLEDQRWQAKFAQDKLNQEDERNWRAQQRERDIAEYDARKPLQSAQLEMTLAQLAQMKKQQEAMTGAAGAAAYTPTTDTGKEAYQGTLAMTGNPMQAGFAAKQAEREAAKQTAAATGSQLRSSLQDFSARDKAVIGFDPTDEDKKAIIAKVEAYAAVLKQAGFNEKEVQAAVEDMLRQTLTSDGRTDTNAGWSEGILKQFNTSFR